MELFREFFENRVLFAAVLAWLVAQGIKVLLEWLLHGKIFRRTDMGRGRYAQRSFGDGLRADGIYGAVPWGILAGVCVVGGVRVCDHL